MLFSPKKFNPEYYPAHRSFFRFSQADKDCCIPLDFCNIVYVTGSTQIK